MVASPVAYPTTPPKASVDVGALTERVPVTLQLLIEPPLIRHTKAPLLPEGPSKEMATSVNFKFWIVAEDSTNNGAVKPLIQMPLSPSTVAFALPPSKIFEYASIEVHSIPVISTVAISLAPLVTGRTAWFFAKFNKSAAV